jgi:hypothetical protein
MSKNVSFDAIWWLRATLYALTPFVVISLREQEEWLTGVLMAMFAILAWGRQWKMVGGVLGIGCAMAALEALCIRQGMWKYFRVEGIVPLWLPILWAITILFLWAIKPYLEE